MATEPTTRYIPLVDWPKIYPWPRLGGLRHLVFHADKNGFEACIRRVGRRVLIDERRFFEWVERQPKGPAHADN